MRIIDIALAILSCFLWGANAVVSKIALQDMSPLMLAVVRFGIVFPCFFVLSLPQADTLSASDPHPSITGYKRIAIGILVVGTLSSIQFYAMNYAMYRGVSAGVISLLVQAGVVFNYFLSWVVFKTPPTKAQLMGASVAILGVFILSGSVGTDLSLFGLLLGIVGAASYGFMAVFLKWSKPKRIMSFVVGHNTVSFLTLLPLLMFDTREFALTSRSALCIIYAGFIANLLGASIWAWLLKHNDQSAKVMQFTTLVPVFAILCGVAFLGEPLTERTLIASSIVLAGIIIGQGTLRLFVPEAIKENA